jgi:hypothetical protein
MNSLVRMQARHQSYASCKIFIFHKAVPLLMRLWLALAEPNRRVQGSSRWWIRNQYRILCRQNGSCHAADRL